MISCGKKEEQTIATGNHYDFLQGGYIGNIYRWHRDYDSTHTNIVESYDTSYNVKADLVIDENSDDVIFDGTDYYEHYNLKTLINNDTILAARMNNLYHTYVRAKIIQSLKFVEIKEAYYSSTGPLAFTVTAEYYKN